MLWKDSCVFGTELAHSIERWKPPGLSSEENVTHEIVLFKILVYSVAIAQVGRKDFIECRMRRGG